MKKGEMGIGTLIIFIALLLVAAIAAAVLIQTAGNLQEKSLSTGEQTRGQVVTKAKVIEVSATNGRNGTLRNFSSIMKLASGSDSLKIEQTILTMNTFNNTVTLSFAGNDAVNELNESNGFWTDASEGTGNFTIEYLQTGNNHVEGNLQKGDIIKIYFYAPRPIGEDEDIRINFIPKIGTPTLTEFTTPDVISKERVYLYP